MDKKIQKVVLIETQSHAGVHELISAIKNTLSNLFMNTYKFETISYEDVLEKTVRELRLNKQFVELECQDLHAYFSANNPEYVENFTKQKIIESDANIIFVISNGPFDEDKKYDYTISLSATKEHRLRNLKQKYNLASNDLSEQAIERLLPTFPTEHVDKRDLSFLVRHNTNIPFFALSVINLILNQVEDR